ncbi:MAG: amidohydrolase, partial [Calditrichaeota bacterium]
MTVYPGLIESFSQVGLPKVKKKGPAQKAKPKNEGAEYWNPYVRPEKEALDEYEPKEDALAGLRKLGFTAALVARDKPIFSGTSDLVSLENGTANEQVLKEKVAQTVIFKRPGGFRSRTYPNSLMGVIALIRQTLLDAQWYGQAQAAYALNPKQTRPETDESLAALQDVVKGKQPVLFKVDNDLNFLRAVKVAKEFGLKTWVLGSGHEYRQLEAIKAAGVPVILPLDFPEPPKVESPEEALDVSLLELSHWDAAPANPKDLYDAGVSFTFTTARLKKTTDFPERVRQALKRGLPEDAALAALTVNPARLFGVADRLGTVETGKLGHLVVTDGDLFGEKTHILDVWVDGHRYEIEARPEVDPRGAWELTFNLPEKAVPSLRLRIQGEPKKLNGKVVRDNTEIKLKT